MNPRVPGLRRIAMQVSGGSLAASFCRERQTSPVPPSFVRKSFLLCLFASFRFQLIVIDHFVSVSCNDRSDNFGRHRIRD